MLCGLGGIPQKFEHVASSSKVPAVVRIIVTQSKGVCSTLPVNMCREGIH